MLHFARVFVALLSLAIIASSNAFTATCAFKSEPDAKAFKVPCFAFTDRAVGINIGNFKAKGSFGKVFAGTLVYEDNILPVAIKKIRLKVPVSGYQDLEGTAARPTAEEARQEFRLMVALYKNAALRPFLVNAYAYFEHNNNAYLVMEDGGDALSSKMDEYQANETALTELATNLFEAIKTLHRNGIVHLDLHPGNVLVDNTGTIRIIDFGFAKPRGKAVKVVGHRQWRDPQVYVLKMAYPAYDYFSVAAILFAIIKGHKIYDSFASNDDLAANPVKPGTPQFERYAELYNKLTEECSHAHSTALYKLVLSLLNPDYGKRVPPKEESATSRSQ